MKRIPGRIYVVKERVVLIFLRFVDSRRSHSEFS